MTSLSHFDLFSGIGGFVLAAQMVGAILEGRRTVVCDFPLLKSNEPTNQESSAVDELQRQIRACVSSLPTQGEIPVETAITEEAANA